MSLGIHQFTGSHEVLMGDIVMLQGYMVGILDRLLGDFATWGDIVKHKAFFKDCSAS